jgi:type II secretory pathway pseudopilin PulG
MARASRWAALLVAVTLLGALLLLSLTLLQRLGATGERRAEAGQRLSVLQGRLSEQLRALNQSVHSLSLQGQQQQQQQGQRTPLAPSPSPSLSGKSSSAGLFGPSKPLPKPEKPAGAGGDAGGGEVEAVAMAPLGKSDKKALLFTMDSISSCESLVV